MAGNRNEQEVSGGSSSENYALETTGNLDTIAGDTTSLDSKVTTCDTDDVTIGSALPAGTNAIGKLSPNSGVDIGDVDVASLPKAVPESGTDDTGADTYATILTPSTTFSNIEIVNEGANPATISIDGGSTDTFIRVAGASSKTYDGVTITTSAIQAKNASAGNNYTNLTITIW